MSDLIYFENQTKDGCYVDGIKAGDLGNATRELGLKPVRAWVKDDIEKVRSQGAAYTKRSRTKAEQRGLKQISITLSAELHPKLKALAARTKAGESADDVLVDIFPHLGGSQGSLPSVEPKHEPHLESLPGWRRWLIRLLIGPGKEMSHELR